MFAALVEETVDTISVTSRQLCLDSLPHSLVSSSLSSPLSSSITPSLFQSTLKTYQLFVQRPNSLNDTPGVRSNPSWPNDKRWPVPPY